jgi:hypothetical protein
VEGVRSLALVNRATAPEFTAALFEFDAVVVKHLHDCHGLLDSFEVDPIVIHFYSASSFGFWWRKYNQHSYYQQVGKTVPVKMILLAPETSPSLTHALL